MSTSLTELENIFVDIEVKDFETVIPLLVKPLIVNQDVLEDFPNQVIERERIFPTGLPTEPYGVAIPHTNAEFVINNKVTIATLKNPIQMELMGGMDEDAIDVTIIFLLALGQSNKQLNILQKLMSILNQEDILTRIKNGTKEEIYKIAKEEIQL
ncbi:PTS sugar transporter subunit IIA [Listeria immobilis]|uniref:PTS sugar transporter subunit IIA n=1 Tax=Listeria immobilis TaxID=2713502 RepID=UPI001625F5A4|nr:PTS sugar transporter subunit IIA [Listeria immobilis]MBC1517156.1 PTS sugar transporter subunit IIA [Listeria immobilis]MBC6298324.1 PTS sugar transporter subunit IIA [Listeria immobilis]